VRESARERGFLRERERARDSRYRPQPQPSTQPAWPCPTPGKHTRKRRAPPAFRALLDPIPSTKHTSPCTLLTRSSSHRPHVPPCGAYDCVCCGGACPWPRPCAFGSFRQRAFVTDEDIRNINNFKDQVTALSCARAHTCAYTCTSNGAYAVSAAIVLRQT